MSTFFFKPSFQLIIVTKLIVLLFFTSALFTQNTTGQNIFRFNIKLQLAYRTEADTAIQRSFRSKVALLHTTPTVEQRRSLLKQSKEQYFGEMTFNQFLQRLTPQSREWFTQFLQNYSPSNSQYIFQNSNSKIKDLRREIIARKTIHSSQRKQQGGHPIPYNESPAAQPNLDGINGSKLIKTDNYAGQIRKVVTLPNQSIYLRGRYDQSKYPYFPYDTNTYCTKCCGPAAGQSILEWFSVPVTNSDGAILTSDFEIQKRLADLMETTDGADFTYPDDLCSTLTRDEFLTWKGFCYKDGGGTLVDIKYMLSAGTPVILLIAEDDWAHFTTVYSYDSKTDEFKFANQISQMGTCDSSRLKSLWDFDNIDNWSSFAFWFVGVNSNTLFSYSPDGADYNWFYQSDLPSYSFGQNIDSIYYKSFNTSYVGYQDENGMNLNFWTLYGFRGSTLRYNRINVTSSNQIINLNPSNQHIISSSNPQDGSVIKCYVGVKPDISVKIDKAFLNEQSKLYCGFIVRSEDGREIISNYNNYSLQMEPSNQDPNNFVFKFPWPYQLNYSTVEFILHGGFRSVNWTLGSVKPTISAFPYLHDSHSFNSLINDAVFETDIFVENDKPTDSELSELKNQPHGWVIAWKKDTIAGNPNQPLQICLMDVHYKIGNVIVPIKCNFKVSPAPCSSTIGGNLVTYSGGVENNTQQLSPPPIPINNFTIFNGFNGDQDFTSNVEKNFEYDLTQCSQKVSGNLHFYSRSVIEVRQNILSNWAFDENDFNSILQGIHVWLLGELKFKIPPQWPDADIGIAQNRLLNSETVKSRILTAVNSVEADNNVLNEINDKQSAECKQIISQNIQESSSISTIDGRLRFSRDVLNNNNLKIHQVAINVIVSHCINALKNDQSIKSTIDNIVGGH